MKNVITFLMCTLCVFTGIAQTDLSGSQMVIPERTPELEALYLQTNQLENNGTAAEINANRLAIKNAWQEVDPAVAALYKPTETGNVSLPTMSEGSYDESRSPQDWDSDGLLREGFIDGLDMDVSSNNGDIYVTAFENYVGTDANLYVYRSTDYGTSFELWKSIVFNNTVFEKIETISIDGSGDNYLLAYMLDENSLFFAVRINMATKDVDNDIVSTDVTDFGVDRNYPGSTSGQRVYATYLKTDGGCSDGDLLVSARSTAGSYGFDWVDETNLGTCARQLDFAYGRDGGSYTTFIGGVSGSLYAKFNSSSNDPGSWENNDNIVNGSTLESLNPTIRAARYAPASDKVIIFTSSRNAGTTDNYDAKGYIRENGGSFAEFNNYPAGGGGDWSIVQPDSWVRKTNDTEIIRTAYVRNRIDESENNTNRSLTFNGTSFDSFEPVADANKDVFEGFPSVIAETEDELPCVAFAGTDVSTGIRYGYNLYFDRKSTLGVEQNSLKDFTFYPNPTQDIVNLSAKNTIENVSIYSLLGQEVLQSSPKQKSPSLNISSLASGIYVMKVEVDGQTGTYKIIKE
ncbi:T9SS type A sorting domain-containing protein [Aequorivita sp. CIP111184]|uniref:T9SS type A sorting domain-containing protein n=1 Tax=Aequorivita sp. CIP111184 TaxID=2211356 RepID=UPI000DBBE808|nr:T9SS type A sorting domain-containing protein [Aequorivita sp. CIP111184]SRX55416.1 hypothetical protein AEQU1_02438 [Aequorivita sp. CIP111184]